MRTDNLRETAGHEKKIESEIYRMVLNKLFIKIQNINSFIENVQIITDTLEQIIEIATYRHTHNLHNDSLPSHYETWFANSYYSMYFVSKKFDAEIKAYRFFFENKSLISDDELQHQVLLILNNEFEVLESKIHGILKKSLQTKLFKTDKYPWDHKSISLIDVFITHIDCWNQNAPPELLIEKFLDKASRTFNLEQIEDTQIPGRLLFICKIASKEIRSYQESINRYKNNMEFTEILALLRQELELDK